jgi:hypothetical protein
MQSQLEGNNLNNVFPVGFFEKFVEISSHNFPLHPNQMSSHVVAHRCHHELKACIALLSTALRTAAEAATCSAVTNKLSRKKASDKL